MKMARSAIFVRRQASGMRVTEDEKGFNLLPFTFHFLQYQLIADSEVLIET